VEDHRNLLILTPARPLPVDAMTTLQAALKRGIEMSFQIEESELVVEPLPGADDRRALLFYEAAEGGAGVLTRLVNSADELRRVAGRALQLMHYRAPANGHWDAGHLDESGHACEAGCYQCLLSYFNQPDHAHINRRHQDVLVLLAALANARVEPAAERPAEHEAAADAELEVWLGALGRAGAARPDALNVPVNHGAAIAAAQYKAARALVFLSAVDAATAAALQDKGWQALDFSEPSRWPQQFAAYPHVFAHNNAA